MSRGAPPSGEGASGAPVALELAVQWGEMDAYGHVNNAVYFRWFESARMAYFARLGWPEIERESGVGPILHSTQARFRAPVTWPDHVEASAQVIEVGEDRFTMRYRVVSRAQRRLVAEGSGVVVAYDYRRQVKASLPAAIRERIAALEAAC